MNYRCCMGVSRKFGRRRYSDSVKEHALMKEKVRKLREDAKKLRDSVKEHALMKEKVRKLREDAKKRLFGDFGDDDDAKKVEIEKVAVDLLGEGETKEGDIKGDLTKKKNHKNKKPKNHE